MSLGSLASVAAISSLKRFGGVKPGQMRTGPPTDETVGNRKPKLPRWVARVCSFM